MVSSCSSYVFWVQVRLERNVSEFGEKDGGQQIQARPVRHYRRSKNNLKRDGHQNSHAGSFGQRCP